MMKLKSYRASRVAVRNRKKLVSNLLEQDEERCRESVNYNGLLAEVFEPYNWLSSAVPVEETDE